MDDVWVEWVWWRKDQSTVSQQRLRGTLFTSSTWNWKSNGIMACTYKTNAISVSNQTSISNTQPWFSFSSCFTLLTSGTWNSYSPSISAWASKDQSMAITVPWIAISVGNCGQSEKNNTRLHCVVFQSMVK